MAFRFNFHYGSMVPGRGRDGLSEINADLEGRGPGPGPKPCPQWGRNFSVPAYPMN